jgi:UDP-glucose 4-epimerase
VGRKKKVLVTGGAGFIGSHVVDALLANGYEVVVVDDLSTGRESNLNPEVTFYKLDIRSQELAEIFEKERPDFVNHHAAQMNVRRSIAEPLFDADVNIRGSLNLIECARHYQVKRFIYVSTGGAVYGEPEYLPCNELHPIRPLSQYGVSKHTVEHYLYLYNINYGLEYNILRYPNVYGPRQDPNGEAGVVAIFIGQMLSGKEVVINGDGDQTRDFVYVGDIARANLDSLSSIVKNEIFNLGSGKGTSVNQIFAQLQRITGYTEFPIHGPAKIGEVRHIYLDASKAAEMLGWTPTIQMKKGLECTVEYFQESEELL